MGFANIIRVWIICTRKRFLIQLKYTRDLRYHEPVLREIYESCHVYDSALTDVSPDIPDEVGRVVHLINSPPRHKTKQKSRKNGKQMS